MHPLLSSYRFHEHYPHPRADGGRKGRLDTLVSGKSVELRLRLRRQLIEDIDVQWGLRVGRERRDFVKGQCFIRNGGQNQRQVRQVFAVIAGENILDVETFRRTRVGQDALGISRVLGAVRCQSTNHGDRSRQSTEKRLLACQPPTELK